MRHEQPMTSLRWKSCQRANSLHEIEGEAQVMQVDKTASTLWTGRHAAESGSLDALALMHMQVVTDLRQTCLEGHV